MPGSAVLLIDPVPAGDSRDDLSATFRRVAPDEPVFTVASVNGWRGDGVFETLGVVDGRPQQLDAHLRRLADSARLSDLPAPDPAQWTQACRTVATDCGPGQWTMRLVLLRPDTAAPSAWVMTAPAPDHHRARTEGVRVALLERGLDSRLVDRMPWLLRGAKTLSYAVNMAAVREARRRGADEVVFVSSDGVVLEGATSSVIVRLGDRFVTPPTGVLPGITQARLFAHLVEQGSPTAYETVPVGELAHADALWLVSSVRLVVPVTAVDGAAMTVDAELTASFNRRLLLPDD